MSLRHLSYKNCHRPGEIVHEIRFEEHTALMSAGAEPKQAGLGRGRKAKLFTNERLSSICKHR